MKGGSTVLLAVLMLATVTAAAAFPAPAALPALAGEATFAALAADPLLAPAFGAALAASTAQASPTAVLQDMLRAAGHGETALPVAFQPMAGAPAELAVPLGRLAAAAAVAEQLRAEAVAALTPEEQAWVLEHGLWSAAPLALPALPSVEGRVEAASPSAENWALDPRVADLAAKVDSGKFRTAALTILAAIEASAPELRVAAATQGPSVASHCVTGTIRFESNNCEVVVGDTAGNGYSNAAIILLVDLGGNDVYTNGGTGLAKSSVRVIVDNAGADTYTATASSTTGGAVTAEGIANAAIGVAVLADLGGNDVYAASAVSTAPQPGPAAGTAKAVAEGVAAIGAAVLVDTGGRDTFRLDARSSGGPASTLGQGDAGVGLGAVLNLGATDEGADDGYTALPVSTLHIVSQTAQQTQYTIGPATAAVQGSGELAGVGVLVDAGGNDVVFAEPRGATATLSAQGSGNGGVGALVDAGGNDAMTARALGDTTLSLVVNNGGSATCWTVTVTVTTGETKAAGHGAGALGAGALVDAGGNDIRVLEARGHAGAIGGVNTAFNCGGTGNRVTTTATSGPGSAVGQGSGESGVGALVDLAGNDVNDLRARSTALASSVINGPGTKFETATATAGTGQDFGQARSVGGVGVLADAAGVDAYLSTVGSTATRVTSAGTSAVTGPVLQNIQAYGNGGLAWLIDLEGADTYASSPAGASPAANNKCWTHGPDGGRGRDVPNAAALLTQSGCLP